MKAAEWTSR